jgi:hypothetical protein
MVLDVAKLSSQGVGSPVDLAGGLGSTFGWFSTNTTLTYEATPRELALIGHG